jgi:hypothetical protein
MAIDGYRRPKRHFAVNRRYYGSGQNALDLLKLKRLKPQMLAVVVALKALKNQADTPPETVDRFIRALTVQMLEYKRLTKMPVNHVHLKFPARCRTIGSFHLQELDKLFRFNSHALLHRLLAVLALPNMIRFRSGNVMSGEECMLLTLRRLISKKTL